MEELFNKITEWQQKTFPTTTALSTAKHLREETEELISSIVQNETDGQKLLELADNVILIFGVCDKLGFTYDELEQAIKGKHLINLNRKHHAPDADGIVRHVK